VARSRQTRAAALLIRLAGIGGGNGNRRTGDTLGHDGHPPLITTMPPAQQQKRLAFGVMATLLVVFAVTVPFRHLDLPPQSAFIPVVDTILFLNDLITAVLLYALFWVTRAAGLLVLASGYLFAALIIVPHALTFPGAFAENGLLGAGLQSAVWLYIFWHLALPPAAIAYALLKGTHLSPSPERDSPVSAVAFAIASVATLALALTWLVTVGERWLPSIMIDTLRANRLWEDVAAPLILTLSLASIVLVWRRRSSVLDLWLLVVLCAWFTETVLLSMTSQRYSLVWYVGRFFGLLSSCFVLLVLLSESTMLYARLALSVAARERERESRLLSVQAVAAAIEHELKQPVTAIIADANAGRRWLQRASPELGEAVEALEAIASEARRAGEVVHALREVFSEDHPPGVALDANQLIRETVGLARDELASMRVAVQLQLAPQLPLVPARRGQLQQVLLNLLTNAAESMRGLTDRPAVVRVTSRLLDAQRVQLAVSDCGTGIDEAVRERIFDAFFTTKPRGMGMGLAICRSIVEAHGGTLSMSPIEPHGSEFCIVLPRARGALPGLASAQG
jgi:signal transduction histidine kinase